MDYGDRRVAEGAEAACGDETGCEVGPSVKPEDSRQVKRAPRALPGGWLWMQSASDQSRPAFPENSGNCRYFPEIACDRPQFLARYRLFEAERARSRSRGEQAVIRQASRQMLGLKGGPGPPLLHYI